MKNKNHKIVSKQHKKLKSNMKRNTLNLWIRLLKIHQENLFQYQNRLHHQIIFSYSKSLPFQQFQVI